MCRDFDYGISVFRDDRNQHTILARTKKEQTLTVLYGMQRICPIYNPHYIIMNKITTRANLEQVH